MKPTKRQMQIWRILENLAVQAQAHVGGRVRYYASGHDQNFGTIERVNAYQNGDDARVEIWLKPEGPFKFSTVIHHDQVRDLIPSNQTGGSENNGKEETDK